MDISRPREALNLLRVLFWTSWLWFLLAMAGLTISLALSFSGVIVPLKGLTMGVIVLLAVALGITSTHTLGELYVKEERLESILRLPPRWVAENAISPSYYSLLLESTDEWGEPYYVEVRMYRCRPAEEEMLRDLRVGETLIVQGRPQIRITNNLKQWLFWISPHHIVRKEPG